MTDTESENTHTESESESESESVSESDSESEFTQEQIDDLLFEVEKDLESIVPKAVEKLLKSVKTDTLYHTKYGNDIYIGPEIHCFCSYIDDIDAIWRYYFKDMGLHIQQYSSGNVRFRIMMSHNDSDNSIGKCLNTYVDAYNIAFKEAKEFCQYERMFHNLLNIQRFVLGSNDHELIKYIKIDKCIVENMNYKDLYEMICVIKKELDLFENKHNYLFEEFNKDLCLFEILFDTFSIQERYKIINNILRSGRYLCHSNFEKYYCTKY
jgi:hypothetical protein